MKIQENTNHTEIAAEYDRIRSVAPGWTPALLRESVVDTFSIKWGMAKDEVAEVVDSYIASSQRRMTTLQELYQLWGSFNDVPTDEDGAIEVKFLDFEKGTHREDIWRWFESQNKNFVIGEIQSGKRRTTELQSMEQASA